MLLPLFLNTKKFSVHLEDRSLDTYENAKFSKEFFQKAGIDKPTIYLVTSAYHMKRAVTLYEHFGFRVIPSATSFQTKPEQNPKKAIYITSFMPNIWALQNSYKALHEYAGLLSLRLRGL